MTSRRQYLCSKTMKRRPFWCTKTILWELNSFLMQTLSFVPINSHICWPREQLCLSKIKPRWWIPFGFLRKKWIPFITYTGFPRKKMRSSILIKCLPPYIIKVVSSRVKNHHFSKFAIFKRLNRAHQELSFKKDSRKKCFFLCRLMECKRFLYANYFN